MLRFFSKIRYNLAAENKVVKYTRYAIGEILLVVIGILIAVQINNWNTSKKDRQTEQQYLLDFVQDFRIDSTRLAYFTYAYPKKIEALLLARTNVLKTMEITDTLSFMDKIGYGGVASKTLIFETRSTYKDIVSTGNLRLIRNKSLRQQILYYYMLGENTQNYLDNLKSDYANFMNSYLPFDSRGTFEPTLEEIQLAFHAIRSNEFLRIANTELTYAYALRVRIDRISELNQAVLKLIEDELTQVQ